LHNGIDDLTERERDTLSLLAQGHDTKSIAARLELSVFTINDRLRSARRKLGTSSSREAARIFADSCAAEPEFLARKEMGMVSGGAGSDVSGYVQPDPKRGRALAWVGGGLLMVALIFAAALFAISQQGATALPGLAGAESLSRAEAQSLPSASEWLTLTDEGKWAESWQASGGFFRSQVSAEQWTAAARSVRDPLGAMTTRSFKSATSAASLPGAPAGEYERIEFTTNFANRKGATETVILVREETGWKVVGYFIR